MLPEFVKFYYGRLPERKQSVYRQLYEGLREHKKRISINTGFSSISAADISEILGYVRLDTPSFYFLSREGIAYSSDCFGYELHFDKFLYSEEQIKQFDKRLNDGLLIFRNRYIKEGMTDYQKEVAIHDYLVKTVAYDYESLNNQEYEKRHKEIYNVLGPLLRKKAVCEGVSLAFKLLCDYCGVKCFVVHGNTTPVQSDSAGHAWNIVRLDNENYHVDVTWDIKKKGDISCIYDYLNLNDSLIKFDHTWDNDIFPLCNSVKHNYYNKNKLYVRALDQIPDYICRKIADGENSIVFKFAGEMPTQAEIVNKISLGLRKAFCFRGWVYCINERQHNVYIELRPR